MLRSRALLVLLLFGCGGRDPLVGIDDEGILVPPLPAAGTGGGSATGGTSGTMPPMSKPPAPDAGAKPPTSTPAPDAATPGKLDAPPSACPFPKCVAALVEECIPAGTCVQQQLSVGGGISSNICYANGVKLMTTIQGGGRNPSTAIKVLKPGGAPCYSIDPEQRGAGVVGHNFRAPTGEIVATATIDRNRLIIVCINQTSPTAIDLSCQPGLSPANGCNRGACP
jgi:hypothetical protein